MGYALRQSQTAPENVRRLVGECVERCVEAIVATDFEDGAGDRDPDAVVHLVRKQLKKVRAAVRLVRPSFSRYREENRRYRDIARRLADLRDAKARLETIDLLQESVGDDFPDELLVRLRAEMEESHTEAFASVDLPGVFGTVSRELREGLEDVPRLELDADGFEALEGGLALTYDRARVCHRNAEVDSEVELMHTFRKRVKYHRHHIEILSPLWENLLEPTEDLLHDITDALGEDHDLAVLREALREESIWHDRAARQRVIAALQSEAIRRRERALILGHRVFSETTDAMVRRMRGYWRAWA